MSKPEGSGVVGGGVPVENSLITSVMVAVPSGSPVPFSKAPISLLREISEVAANPLIVSETVVLVLVPAIDSGEMLPQLGGNGGGVGVVQ